MRQAEGGAAGAAVASAYTKGLMQLTGVATAIWMGVDTWQNTGFLELALGTRSTGWTIALLGLFLLTSGAAMPLVAALYARYSGFAFVEDRLGFAKAGGADIAFWSWFFAYAIVLTFFARYVEPFRLGWARPPLVWLTGLIAANVLARAVATVVFSTLFGRPAVYRMRP